MNLNNNPRIIINLLSFSVTLIFHVIIRGAIQNYVDFFFNFKTENQPHMELGKHSFMYLASLCKVLTNSDFICDRYGTSNTTGVAIAGQR